MYNEEELVIKSQNGDVNAFEELVCRYERKIYTMAYRIMGNHEDASDSAQEAFLRAFKSIKKFRRDASFLTWMGCIVTNVCRDELRKRYKMSFESLDEKVCLDEGEVVKQIASEQLGPPELFEAKELQIKIQNIINQLSPEFRLTLVLRDIQGLSYEEIAEKLECSLGTVKSRISRARNHLKNMLLSEMEQFKEYERLFS